MKNVELKKLSLYNWRAQNKTIEFGNKTMISGRNMEGKSTIFNAWLWLLLGTDEYDRANYQLFDNTIEPTYDNSKTAIVEGVVAVDGMEYSFRKEASIGWIRKRGNTEYERKGTDNYRFFIDDIERGATEYRKTIDELFAPADKLKIMLNTRYFLSLDWKDMRHQMECMVGEIAKEDFKGDYSAIWQDLDKYSVEDLRTSYKAKIKHVRTAVDGLPTAIETLQGELPDLSQVDDIERTIAEARNRIESIDASMLSLSEKAKPYAQKHEECFREMMALRGDYEKAKCEHEQAAQENIAKLQSALSEVKKYNEEELARRAEEQEKIQGAKAALQAEEQHLEALIATREELLSQNKSVKALTFTDTNCPYCGQPLPEDKLEEAKAAFMTEKEAKHLSIVAEGKANNVKMDEVRRNIERLRLVAEKEITENPLRNEQEIQEAIRQAQLDFTPFAATEKGKELLSLVSQKQKELDEMPNGYNNEDGARLSEEKKELLRKIEQESARLGIKAEYKRLQDRITSLQGELRDNAAMLALLEGKLAKLTEYEREKAAIVSERVNGKFDYVSVKMTDTNKSGDIVDTCIITDNQGVNAAVTNNANRMRCAVDIALAFQRFYNVSLPLFLDNYELFSTENRPQVEGQEIRLVVADEPFTVRVL